MRQVKKQLVKIAPIKHHHHSNEISVLVKMKVNALPKRHIKLVASRSQAGKKENGLVKINQDSYLVIQKWNKLNDYNLVGVFDVYGKDGHYVSQYATKYFLAFFKKIKKLNLKKLKIRFI